MGSEEPKLPVVRSIAWLDLASQSSGRGVGQVVRCVVKGDRRLGSVLPNQVDDRFEKLQFFIAISDPATNNDAVPRPGLKPNGDSSLDIVAAVQSHQAGFCMKAAIGKSGHTDLDRVRDRLRVPRAGHPIGVETDDKDIGVRDGITH